MRRLLRPIGVALGLFVALASCAPDRSAAPKLELTRLSAGASLVDFPAVRISEIHYDNAGTDAGEAIEISGPAGTSLVGWQIVRYNGASASRLPYTTPAALSSLPISIPATCGSRGVAVVTYAVNGLQNGGTTPDEPDGVALVDAGGTVVEFLSYEGTFVAAGGAAAGKTSADIAVREAGNDPVGYSLQRNGANAFMAPRPNSLGQCNDVATESDPVTSVAVQPPEATIFAGASQTFLGSAFSGANNVNLFAILAWSTSASDVASVNPNGVATGVAPGDAEITATVGALSATAKLHVNELPPLPSSPLSIVEIHYDNSGTDANERIEIRGPKNFNVAGWSLVLYNGNGGVTYTPAPVVTGSTNANCPDDGVISFAAPGLQNGDPDGIALVNPGGQVVEFISYGGAFRATNGPAAGRLSTDIGVKEGSSTSPGLSLQKDALGWYGPAPSSFDVCNVAPPPFVSITGRFPSDPPLPVGFEDQLFGTLNDGRGGETPSTFTWSSDSPEIIEIDARGVMRARSAGTAIIRAKAADGREGSISLPTHVAVASTTAQYVGNTEFGEPTDGNASDDFIIRRAQYTTSYNKNRGIPNWVSFNLEETHFGLEDRCDCFTFDPELPAGFTHYNTADYTDAGKVAGYGIDRGHMARSFDRTSASLDNATTYYFSNIVPQASDNNQGPWADMEIAVGNRARFDNKELYIIAGASGTKGTVKNEGKITIPASVWKVVVIMDRNKGLADVHSPADVEVIAVIMPNDAGLNPNWETYKTTVDAVEALSGYDLLALLPDKVERAVESNTKPPIANIASPATSTEGAPVTVSAAQSVDLNGTIVSYAWTFGDGGTSSDAVATHTYAQNGMYTVRLVVTDNDGLLDEETTTIQVSNVAPTIAGFGGATLVVGETYAASSSFDDPGADTWSATVDYGDGSGVWPLPLSGKSFTLSHTYGSHGTFRVIVRVADGDDTSESFATVKVLARPVADAGGSYVSSEGAAVTLNGGASSDADGSIVQYEWTFGDGGTANGVSPSHTYVQDGTYTVGLTVTDNDGLTSSSNATVQVSNVAPSINAFFGATLFPGETYSVGGSFTDPGADPWSATVNYGDGSGFGVLALAGKNFSLAHTYETAGTFTVTVRISDDLTTSERTQTVTVLTTAQGIQNVIALLDQLEPKSGKIDFKKLRSRLETALKQLDKDKDHTKQGVKDLEKFLEELDETMRSGGLTAAQAEPMRVGITRVIRSLTR